MRRWGSLVAASCLTAACPAPGPFGTPPAAVVPTTPVILDFVVDCEVDGATWTMTVDASSSTGGGTSWWTVDGSYVERHVVLVSSSEPDASHDTLTLNLSVVADWRDQRNGSSTAFPCGAEPQILFQLDDIDGVVVDCRQTGSNTEIWELVDGVSGCDELVE